MKVNWMIAYTISLTVHVPPSVVSDNIIIIILSRLIVLIYIIILYPSNTRKAYVGLCLLICIQYWLRNNPLILLCDNICVFYYYIWIFFDIFCIVLSWSFANRIKLCENKNFGFLLPQLSDILRFYLYKWIFNHKSIRINKILWNKKHFFCL